MATITTHTRRTDQGFTSYVQIRDGAMRRREATHITRTTRADAQRDADTLKEELLCGLWTEERVREERPAVQVRIGDRFYTGTVRSHAGLFAMVTMTDGHLTQDLEYAWATIVRSLNTGQALLA